MLSLSPSADIGTRLMLLSVGALVEDVDLSVGGVDLSVHDDLSAVEAEWRAFERVADCTVFQTFAYQSAWQRHIGAANGTIPAVVMGRRAGRLLFIFPLAIGSAGPFRQLCWLGSDFSDYNGPLLSPDFATEIAAADFPALWDRIVDTLQRGSRSRHHVVALEKMLAEVGRQPNPFLELGVEPNPSGAYWTPLSSGWDQFYAAKRSSTTRRRDRSKRQRLGEFGEVRFVTAEQPDEIAATLQTLFAQKAKALARIGVANLFARPGHAAFFLDLATDPATRDLVHVSRLEIGDIFAATNLALTFRQRYHHVLSSYGDGEVSRFGPGAAHLHDLMRHAIASGCREFDFTIGDEPYKRDWCEARTSLYDHRSAATLAGVAGAASSIVFARLKRTIKQNPFLWRAFARARALIGSWRARAWFAATVSTHAHEALMLAAAMHA